MDNSENLYTINCNCDNGIGSITSFMLPSICNEAKFYFHLSLEFINRIYEIKKIGNMCVQNVCACSFLVYSRGILRKVIRMNKLTINNDNTSRLKNYICDYYQ